MVGQLAHQGANPADFVPNFKNYLAYNGSYTTPPCTEGVRWVLLNNPLYIYQQDLDAITALEHKNIRPTQPLNGRKVSTSIPA